MKRTKPTANLEIALHNLVACAYCLRDFAAVTPIGYGSTPLAVRHAESEKLHWLVDRLSEHASDLSNVMEDFDGPVVSAYLPASIEAH